MAYFIRKISTLKNPRIGSQLFHVAQLIRSVAILEIIGYHTQMCDKTTKQLTLSLLGVLKPQISMYWWCCYQAFMPLFIGTSLTLQIVDGCGFCILLFLYISMWWIFSCIQGHSMAHWPCHWCHEHAPIKEFGPVPYMNAASWQMVKFFALLSLCGSSTSSQRASSAAFDRFVGLQVIWHAWRSCDAT